MIDERYPGFTTQQEIADFRRELLEEDSKTSETQAGADSVKTTKQSKKRPLPMVPARPIEVPAAVSLQGGPNPVSYALDTARALLGKSYFLDSLRSVAEEGANQALCLADDLRRTKDGMKEGLGAFGMNLAAAAYVLEDKGRIPPAVSNPIIYLGDRLTSLAIGKADAPKSSAASPKEDPTADLAELNSLEKTTETIKELGLSRDNETVEAALEILNGVNYLNRAEAEDKALAIQDKLAEELGDKALRERSEVLDAAADKAFEAYANGSKSEFSKTELLSALIAITNLRNALKTSQE